MADYLDKLGQPIALGSYVVSCHRNMLYISKVTKLNPKMLTVLDVKTTSYKVKPRYVYPSETVVLTGPDVLAYILKF